MGVNVFWLVGENYRYIGHLLGVNVFQLVDLNHQLDPQTLRFEDDELAGFPCFARE